MIRSTERIDGGTYTCAVKNDHGQQEKSTKLVVVEVPEAPLDVRVNEIWSKSASIQWSAPFSGNSQILKYILRYWKSEGHSGHRYNRYHGNNQVNNRLMEKEIPPSTTSFMMKELSPGQLYAASIVAVNEVGISESSLPIRFITGEEEPTGVPSDLAVTAKGSKSVLVTWKPPPRSTWNGNLTGFYVQYKPLDVSQPYIKTVPFEGHHHSQLSQGHGDHVHNSSHVYKFLLTGLIRLKTYLISVKAFNNAGPGPVSNDASVTTLAGDLPIPPKFESFNLLSRTSARLNWRYPMIMSMAPTDPMNDQAPSSMSLVVPTSTSTMGNADLSGFILYAKRNDLDYYTNIIPLPRQLSSFVVTDLQPGIKYSFFLSAVNPVGESDLSEPLDINLHSNPFGMYQTFSPHCIRKFDLIVLRVSIENSPECIKFTTEK